MSSPAETGKGGTLGQASSVATQLSARKRKSRYLIDPRSSSFLPLWDAVTGIALIYKNDVRTRDARETGVGRVGYDCTGPEAVCV